MKVILSPAKKLNYEPEEGLPKFSSEISYAKDSEKLIKKLRGLSSSDIGQLMKLSPALSDLNFGRYQNWTFPFNKKEVKQAAFAFNGEAYVGLDIRSFSDQELNYAQQNLRLLSGLYGILKPMDEVLPYRLEMGTRLKYSGEIKNLYQFWGDKLTKHLKSEMTEGELLLNVASNEYSKVLNLKSFGAQVITPVFKECKGDDFKVVMVYAKRARGLMAAYALRNKVQTVEEVQSFNLERYSFNPELSTEGSPVFTR